MARQRTARGRFAKGNSGGPGRPSRKVEAAYQAALLDALTLERWRAVVERAIVDATDGDARARAWLASYVLGLPQAAGGAGGDEDSGELRIHVIRETAPLPTD